MGNFFPFWIRIQQPKLLQFRSIHPPNQDLFNGTKLRPIRTGRKIFVEHIFSVLFSRVGWKNIPHIHGIFLSIHVFKLHVPLHLHNSTLLYLRAQNQNAKQITIEKTEEKSTPPTLFARTSVPDPDPPDPHVFGPPGSGSGDPDPSIIKQK